MSRVLRAEQSGWIELDRCVLLSLSTWVAGSDEAPSSRSPTNALPRHTYALRGSSTSIITIPCFPEKTLIDDAAAEATESLLRPL